MLLKDTITANIPDYVVSTCGAHCRAKWTPDDSVNETYELLYKKKPYKFYTIVDAKKANVWNSIVKVKDAKPNDWILTENDYVTQVCAVSVLRHNVNSKHDAKLITLACGRYNLKSRHSILARREKSRVIDYRGAKHRNQTNIEKMVEMYVLFGDGWFNAHKRAFEGVLPRYKLNLDSFLRQFNGNKLYRKKVMSIIRDKMKELDIDESWVASRLKGIAETKNQTAKLLMWSIDSVREMLQIDKEAIASERENNNLIPNYNNPRQLFSNTNNKELPSVAREYVDNQKNNGNGKKEVVVEVIDESVEFSEKD